MDKLGPFSSFMHASGNCDYFRAFREEGYVDLYYRSDVPVPFIWEILAAQDGCSFTLSNKNGRVNIKDIKTSQRRILIALPNVTWI